MKNQDGDPPDTEVMNSDSNDRMTAQEASPTEAASRFVRRRSLARELLAAQCLEAELSIDPNLFTMEPAVTPFDGEHSVPELSQESPCDNDPAVSMSAQETRSNEAAPSVDRVNFSETRVEYECTHSIEEGNEDSKQEMEIEEEEESVYPEESRDPEDSKHDTFSRATFSRAPNEIEEEGDPFSNIAAADSKYTTYNVAVNPYQEDRAVDIPLYSSARPHMRAFHLAWGAFFVAFFTWFAMTPLLGEIAISLDLSREEIWTSSVLAVSSSAATRILMGPLNDRYGARWVMSVTLVLAAIPTGLAGLVDSANSLYVVRFLIGVAGSAFVTCQYWTSCMFTMEIAGTANALAAGWGNMGGGVAQVVMGSLLFPLFKIIFGGEGYQRFHGLDKNSDDERPDYDRASDLAWRVILVFPALLSLGVAWVVVRHADDTPKGNTSRRLVEPISATTALSSSISNRNTWLLSFQYACCFGVEITMIQAAALYFQEEFGQSTEAAAAIASIFGWINLFARGIGGYCSDMANVHAGLRGRLVCQVVALCMEGILVIVFSFTQTLGGAILVMIIFSVFVQAAEGSTYGIVPYVDPKFTGSIAGFVAAGGNLGGVGFSLLFRGLSDDRAAFLWMGCAVLGSAFFTALIYIRGHRTLLAGVDSYEVTENLATAEVPRFISFASPVDPESATTASTEGPL